LTGGGSFFSIYLTFKEVDFYCLRDFNFKSGDAVSCSSATSQSSSFIDPQTTYVVTTEIGAGALISSAS